jgi:YesN/AraC family two-component response regulator
MQYQALIADDEKPIRDIIKEFLAIELNERGYTKEGADYLIYLAKDGIEALQILRENSTTNRSIDLVITDVYMPGKTGLEVLAEAREFSPSTKFIVCSAAMTTELKRSIESYGGIPLNKPFNMADFANAVEPYLPSSAQ